ncbi:MAG: ABC transporter ATP-binding protein, partial [Rikenellaceae bacterium]|nr:ABC transporter ATP-binding protein [Rikenellaceae bacterium]
MDMRSKDVLKRALKEYDGTLIVVSHDREFLEGLVSKVYEFSDGRVREHLGGIDDFLYRHKIESMAQIEASSAGKASSGAAAVKDASSEASVKAGGRQRSFHEQKELERARRKLRVAVDNAEAEIERIERAIREYDNKMADPQAYGLDMSDASLFDDYNTLKSQYNKEMNKWEAATEALDDFDAKNGF